MTTGVINQIFGLTILML